MHRYPVKHFPDVPVRKLPKKVSIWISALNKAHDPPQCGGASSKPRRTCVEQRTEERESQSLSCSTWFLELGCFTSPAPGLECMWLIPLLLRSRKTNQNLYHLSSASPACQGQNGTSQHQEPSKRMLRISQEHISSSQTPYMAGSFLRCRHAGDPSYLGSSMPMPRSAAP